MNETRSVKLIQLGKTIFAGLLLVALAAAFGLFWGSLASSPHWQNAVRIAVLGGLIVVIFSSPVNGLLLWVILSPYALAPYTTLWHILNIRLPPGIPDLTMGRLIIGVLSIVWVAQLASGKRRMRRFGAVEVFMAIFCIMVLPSVAAGLSGINRTVQTLFDKFIMPFLVFLLAKNLYEEEVGLDKLGGTLVVIGGYLSFMVFHEHVTGQPLFYQFGRTLSYTRSLPKIVSLLGNPAFLGTVLGMIVPVALFKFVWERSMYTRVLYGALFLVALLGNFFCYNRGAWLALIASLLVMIIFNREYRRILLPIILIVALVGLVYWQALSETAVVSERLSNTSSLRFRLNMLEVSRKLIRDHPLFGVGFDNFGYYYLQYGGYWPTLAYDIPTPHNTYILVLSTMGFVAFIPYVLIFLSMLWEMRTAIHSCGEEEQRDRSLLVSGYAVLTVYTVSAAAVDLYVNTFTSIVFFLIMGIILGHASYLRASQTRLRETRG